MIVDKYVCVWFLSLSVYYFVPRDSILIVGLFDKVDGFAFVEVRAIRDVRATFARGDTDGRTCRMTAINLFPNACTV